MKITWYISVVTGRRRLSNNAIILAIRAWTLGNPEALLDPFVYFLWLVTGMGGFAVSEFSHHDIISPPRRSFYTITAQKRTLRRKRSAHVSYP